ncbi:unnamed protein product [Aphanomyces euteiches]
MFHRGFFPTDQEKSMDVDLAQVLFQAKNVWIYKVPLLTRDPRADEWDVEKPLLTGSLRVVQLNEECYVNLYEANDTLLAQCPIEIDSTRNLDVFVQDCVDSSRYFVVRAVDPKSKRQAFVGIGFPERPAAFNFKAALLDFAKYKLRTLSLENKQSAVAKTSPPKDLSLPEGTKMRIHIGGKAEVVKATETTATTSTDANAWRLAPPPGFQLTSSNVPTDSNVAVASPAVLDEDEWGEFK